MLPASRPKWVSPAQHWADCSRERKELLQAAWQLGEIKYHLTPSQQKAYDKIRAWERLPYDDGIYALDSSRRWGKSALCCVLALENAIRHKGWRIVYCAPEYKMVRQILQPLMALLTIDCPPNLQPEWKPSKDTYEFRNGSRIELIGLDVNPDGARGTGIDYGFVDEAAFFGNLQYLLDSVMGPMTMGREDWARIICASTPPVSPSHYWSSDLVPRAVTAGAHDIRTLLEADQYTQAAIDAHIKKAGGRKSVTCRREYFCEHITDETMAVVPEFREVREKIVVDPGKLPHWYLGVTSMDPGWKDLTAVLFGHIDFDQQKLVVMDEVAAPRLNSHDVAVAIKQKEASLWTGVQCKGSGNRLRQQPYMRVSDNDPRLLNDLSRDHDLAFTATLKDNFDQQINALRVAIQTERINIHPRCKKLVLHLMNATWKNGTRKQFAWENGQFGHFDLVAALLYMWRLAQTLMKRNPAPFLESYVKTSEHNSQLGKQTGSKWSRRANKYYVR